jgi:hypothetical protein
MNWPKSLDARNPDRPRTGPKTKRAIALNGRLFGALKE